VQTDEWEMLGKAILSLPNRERLIFTLYYYEGLTPAQVEHLLDETESSISGIHTSALAHLQSRLAELDKKTPVVASETLRMTTSTRQQSLVYLWSAGRRRVLFGRSKSGFGATPRPKIGQSKSMACATSTSPLIFWKAWSKPL
jgi:hypothetical protein